MSDTKIDSEEARRRKRIVLQCSVETGIGWLRMIRGVLFESWPISNIKRETVYRWALEKRILGARDAVVRPPRVRKKPVALPSVMPVVKKLEAAIEAEVASATRPQTTTKQSQAADLFDAIVRGLELREGMKP